MERNSKQKMTHEEFDNWLESIGGLENGFYPYRPRIMGGIASVGEGWLPLVKELIEKLVELGWDRQICQIKEKFGGLRFYPGSATQEMHEVICKYENLSYETCEDCGVPGKQRNGGWIRTLCDKCNLKDHKIEKYNVIAEGTMSPKLFITYEDGKEVIKTGKQEVEEFLKKIR